MKHFAWDYEGPAQPPYYHIYPCSAAGERLMGGFENLCLVAAESPENDAHVQAITAALDALAEQRRPQALVEAPPLSGSAP